LAIDSSAGKQRFGLPRLNYDFNIEDVVPVNPYDTRDSQYEKYHKLELEEEARRA